MRSITRPCLTSRQLGTPTLVFFGLSWLTLAQAFQPSAPADPATQSNPVMGIAFLSVTAKPQKRYTCCYRDATVFRNRIRNGKLDAGERSEKTGGDGSFNPPKGKGRPYLQGGVDVQTDKPNTLLLTAAASQINGFIGTDSDQLTKLRKIASNAAVVFKAGDFPILSAKYTGQGLRDQVKGDIYIPGNVSGTPTPYLKLASIASDGTQGNGNLTFNPSVSADGRYVAFTSDATNLVPGDGNNT